MAKSFENEIAALSGEEVTALIGSYKYCVYGGKTAVVEGHGGLLCYGAEKIIFRLGKKTLEITGFSLTVRALQKNYAVVKGDIIGAEVK